jgi:hypothetical protein
MIYFLTADARRHFADSIFALADLTKAKLHALRANSFSVYFIPCRIFINKLVLKSIFKKYFPRSGMNFFWPSRSLGQIVCAGQRLIKNFSERQKN